MGKLLLCYCIPIKNEGSNPMLFFSDFESASACVRVGPTGFCISFGALNEEVAQNELAHG